MAVIGYLRVSGRDQSTESQRAEIEKRFSVGRWWSDDAVSGSVPALKRVEFSRLMDYVRDEDTVVVYAIDRLGRDTIDVLNTVKALQDKGVTVVSIREGFDLSTPIGKAMLTMMAAMAEMERENIRARQRAGIDRAKANGRHIGRPRAADPAEIAKWRKANQASISLTARQFGVSDTTVKRACKEVQGKFE